MVFGVWYSPNHTPVEYMIKGSSAYLDLITPTYLSFAWDIVGLQLMVPTLIQTLYEHQ